LTPSVLTLKYISKKCCIHILLIASKVCVNRYVAYSLLAVRRFMQKLLVRKRMCWLQYAAQVDRQ